MRAHHVCLTCEVTGMMTLTEAEEERQHGHDVHPLICTGCGGSAEEPRGCRSCCRDCGFFCDQDKDVEGFHEA